LKPLSPSLKSVLVIRTVETQFAGPNVIKLDEKPQKEAAQASKK